MGQTYGHSLTAVTNRSVPLSHSLAARRVADVLSAMIEFLLGSRMWVNKETMASLCDDKFTIKKNETFEGLKS